MFFILRIVLSFSLYVAIINFVTFVINFGSC